MACRCQKVGGCKGSENKPICRDCAIYFLIIVRENNCNSSACGFPVNPTNRVGKPSRVFSKSTTVERRFGLDAIGPGRPGSFWKFPMVNIVIIDGQHGGKISY